LARWVPPVLPEKTDMKERRVMSDRRVPLARLDLRAKMDTKVRTVRLV
jgi:hypothetical protein